MDLTLESTLMTASNAQQLAAAVIGALRDHETVTLDFVSVEIVTPSFANTFIMTLLAEFPLSDLRARCLMVNRSKVVSDAFNRAAMRWMSGVRLSNQMVPA